MQSTYSKLSERHQFCGVNFTYLRKPDCALAEVLKDYERYETNNGYMEYKQTGLFLIAGKLWAMARGEPPPKSRHYPICYLYDSDLLAFELDERKSLEQVQQKELKDKIRQSSYFKNSLLIGMVNGN